MLIILLIILIFFVITFSGSNELAIGGEEEDKLLRTRKHMIGYGASAIVYKINDDMILRKSKLAPNDKAGLNTPYKREIEFFEMVDKLPSNLQKHFMRLIKYDIVKEDILNLTPGNRYAASSDIYLNQYITYINTKIFSKGEFKVKSEEEKEQFIEIHDHKEKFVKTVYGILHLIDTEGWYHGDIHLNNIMANRFGKDITFVLIDYETVGKSTGILIDSKKFLLNCVLLVSGNINLPSEIGGLEPHVFLYKLLSEAGSRKEAIDDTILKYGDLYTSDDEIGRLKVCDPVNKAIAYLMRKYKYSTAALKGILNHELYHNKPGEQEFQAIQLDFMIFLTCRYRTLIEGIINREAIPPKESEPLRITNALNHSPWTKPATVIPNANSDIYIPGQNRQNRQNRQNQQNQKSAIVASDRWQRASSNAPIDASCDAPAAPYMQPINASCDVPAISSEPASSGFSRQPSEPVEVVVSVAPAALRFRFPEPLISLDKVLELNECNTYQKILAKLSEPGYFG